MKALHATPGFTAAIAARMKARHLDPEFAAAHSVRMAAQNADPEFKAAIRTGRRAAKRAGRHLGKHFKLTDEQIESARRDISAGKTRAEIAREYGVGTATLDRAFRRNLHKPCGKNSRQGTRPGLG